MHDSKRAPTKTTKKTFFFLSEYCKTIMAESKRRLLKILAYEKTAWEAFVWCKLDAITHYILEKYFNKTTAWLADVKKKMDTQMFFSYRE